MMDRIEIQYKKKHKMYKNFINDEIYSHLSIINPRILQTKPAADTPSNIY